MKKQMLEVGKILNTHGVRGELKVQSWLNDPVDFQHISALYIGQRPYPLRSARVQGQNALLLLEGITSIDEAMPLKNQVVSARREELPIAPGAHFVADLIGMDAVDAATGAVFGTVTDVLEYPAQDLYQIAGLDGKEYLVPDVPAFVAGIEDEKGAILIHLMEGLGQ